MNVQSSMATETMPPGPIRQASLGDPQRGILHAEGDATRTAWSTYDI